MRRSITTPRRSPPNRPGTLPTMRRHENEPFVVNREVRAVVVPAGQEVKLKPGQAGYITQALGGSFTVYLEGNLFRIAGEDADAIGQDAVKPPELPPNATEERSEEHTSELQSQSNLVCRLLLEKKKKKAVKAHMTAQNT